MRQFIITACALVAFSTPAFAQLNPDFSTFPKWQRVIENEKVTPGKTEPSNRIDLLNQIQAKYWKIPYLEDAKIYGKEDYWATRAETKAKGAADCEDFAIGEYFDLLEAGVPEQELLISVVLVRETHELHAYLQAYGYVLDRRVPRVITKAEADRLYAPIFSISRLGWRAD